MSGVLCAEYAPVSPRGATPAIVSDVVFTRIVWPIARRRSTETAGPEPIADYHHPPAAHIAVIRILDGPPQLGLKPKRGKVVTRNHLHRSDSAWPFTFTFDVPAV
jgi:hypothetical protein